MNSRSDRAFNMILRWEERAMALKLLLADKEKADRRKLLPKAVAILCGQPDPGEYTDTLFDAIERVIELEIETGWTKYAEARRAEHELAMRTALDQEAA
jgi:hypothetical protein